MAAVSVWAHYLVVKVVADQRKSNKQHLIDPHSADVASIKSKQWEQMEYI